MEVEKHSTEISVSTLWKVFTKRFLLLLIIGIVCFTAIFAYSYIRFSMNPQYESTAKMFILRQNTINGGMVDDNNYIVAEMVAKDCEAILHERVVLERVIKELKADGVKLDMTWKELEKRMKTSLAEESLNLSVTVTADSPEMAKKIVDKICQVGQEEIKETMLEDHANFYQDGEIIKEPCNRPNLILMLAITLAVVFLSYVAFVFSYVKNDYIGSVEEIEQRLGTAVLGDIPDADRINGKKYGYYYSYGARKAEGKEKQK